MSPFSVRPPFEGSCPWLSLFAVLTRQKARYPQRDERARGSTLFQPAGSTFMHGRQALQSFGNGKSRQPLHPCVHRISKLQLQGGKCHPLCRRGSQPVSPLSVRPLPVTLMSLINAVPNTSAYIKKSPLSAKGRASSWFHPISVCQHSIQYPAANPSVLR